jgi:hypothetical protein
MSQVKRDMGRNEALHYQAIEVALQAKALKECCFPGHSDWLLDQGDDEAARLAYTIGTDRRKNGEIDGAHEEFLDAIRHAIKSAPYDSSVRSDDGKGLICAMVGRSTCLAPKRTFTSLPAQ